jgi:hypothetical protein
MALDLALRARSLVGAPERATPGGVIRDLDLLAPAFRAKVLDLVARMIASGWDPIVHETWRSPERAAMLAASGRGIAKSMHCYSLAVDIISASKRWSAPFAFWRDLRDHAEALGLVSGARFSRRDLPHVQGVPIAKQALVRRLHAEYGQARVDEWAAKHLA